MASSSSHPSLHNVIEQVTFGSKVQSLVWESDHLALLDQRLLPHMTSYLKLRTAEEVASAIRKMIVRGAPAIGIAAAYAIALAAQEIAGRFGEVVTTESAVWQERFGQELDAAYDILVLSRPTAINLFAALQRMKATWSVALRHQSSPLAVTQVLIEEASNIHREDLEANHRMADLGLEIMLKHRQEDLPLRLMTHCNTGALATGGLGTALGVIRRCHQANCLDEVFLTETRPWCQGSRLTAWELFQDHIPARVIVDSAAAHVMQRHSVDWLIVGADRITAKGDVANKIGTLSLAVLAKSFGVKVMVVAPTSTIDLNLESGDTIPIEERSSEEIFKNGQHWVSNPQFAALNPVFDVTPAEFIDALVTEKGVLENLSATGVHPLFE
ncbi:MAG: S-methyl-5-thioribose-1-phosphate isomerase [Pseudomonadota bacterium]